MRSANVRYLPQVDHLRAIAALWIIIYHGEQLFEAMLGHARFFSPDLWQHTRNPLWALVIEGHTAVSLFMVLSGFIFTYGAYGSGIDYKAFIINRLLRIYPLYMVVIFVSLAVNPASYTFSSFVSTVLPLANVEQLHTGAWVEMSWAVAIEFQFYLIYAFLLAALNKSAFKTIGGVLSVALLFRLLGVALGGNPRDISYWHLLGRIDQFVLGMGAAALLRHVEQRKKLLTGIFLCSMPLVLGVIFIFHRLGGWPSSSAWKVLWPTVEGLAWSACVLGYVGMPSFLSPGVSRAVARIGEVSFSIYLLHFVVIDVFLRHPNMLLTTTGDGRIAALLTTVLLVVPCTIACSFLTYRVIELPFLNMRRPYLRHPHEAEQANAQS